MPDVCHKLAPVIGFAELYCSSTKLFFTTDGKSKISDETKLYYYMSLTGEVRAFLSIECSSRS